MTSMRASAMSMSSLVAMAAKSIAFRGEKLLGDLLVDGHTILASLAGAKTKSYGFFPG
jgi:hypothetical protein